ncbi:MAG: hypothetical protein MJ188_03590 [Treponema sp.]|nr:hypothetical protein [Treponema sp.]
MDKNRRNKKNWNNQKNYNNSQQNNRSTENNKQQKTFQFNPNNYSDENARREKQKAIQELKNRKLICDKCGQPITDVATAMNDKKSGKPVHFDCVFAEVEKNEKLGPNEKVAYIGQGRFGVLSYENIRDQRHFTIKKIIEWENRDEKPEWRDEISSLYSQVN